MRQVPESPGDLVAIAQRLLDASPEAPLRDRACLATVIACGGKVEAGVTFGEIAEVLGESANDVLTGLLANREQYDIAATSGEKR